MKDSTKRFYSLMASFAMAIGALVVYTTMISPTLAEIQTLRGERQAKQNTYDDYRKTIETTNAVLARSQSLSTLTDTFNQSIPESESIPSLLNQLYGLARLNNVIVSAIDFQVLPTEVAPKDSIVRPLGKVRATVKCIGNYDDMKDYAKAIEANVRLMDIGSLDVSDGNKNNPSLIYAIAVDAYYQP
jgi:Tfp pilus assembly protein PilO